MVNVKAMAEAHHLLKAVIGAVLFAAAESPASAQRLAPMPEPKTLEPRLELVAATPRSGRDERSASAVHLASYYDEADAVEGWQVLLGMHPVLRRHEPLTATVDLGEKGVFVRLLAGPLPSEDAAFALCRELVREGAYCTPANTAGDLSPQTGTKS
jgi:hypothetical protein